MVARILLIVVVWALLVPSLSRAAARFVPLGGDFSIATGVSADGTIVVGESTAGAFRWTQATGMASLGAGPGAYTPRSATAISGDGQRIVGMLSDGMHPEKPFAWTQAGGVIALAPRFTPPAAISYDGTMIIGGTGDKDLSWDGSVAMGNDSSEGYIEKSGVRTWMGDLMGGDYRSAAKAVSPDGSVVVGQSATLFEVEGGSQIETDLAIYWTESAGLVPLGSWNGAVANDISQPKLVVIGYGSPTPGAASESFRWTPATGMKSVRELLLAQGVNVAAMGWTLDFAKAVSADGRIIVGTGVKAGGNPQAWLVELSIPGDFDDDGDSDGNDFLVWQRGFGTNYNAADLDDWRANLAFLKSISHPATVSATTPIPEPPSATILIILTLSFMGLHASQFNKGECTKLIEGSA